MKKDSDAKKMDNAPGGEKTAVARLETAKAASTQPSWGKPTGTVTFTQVGDNKVKAAYDLKGLAPGKHGFHIHEKGDLSAADFSSAGPHFNPTKHKHEGTTGENRHAGDLGNVEADTSGNSKGDVTVEGLTIGSGAATDIVGRSIVVHEKADDMKTDPSGNSGARISAGVIEAKK
jgi:Cu-Zn family superoxide dismutase